MTTKLPYPRCAYCQEKYLMHGELRNTVGTGLYVKCPNCGRWQLVPITTAGDSASYLGTDAT